LSQVDKLPVLYVFEKYELDLNQVKEELDNITVKMNNKELLETKIAIVYDVSYHHLYGKKYTFSSKMLFNELMNLKIV
jgi:diphthamide biosynthesis enzyme Dph1/Dph2-like protein